MSRRTSLVARVARLEESRPSQWQFDLIDGQTVSVSVRDSLKALGEALSALYAEETGQPVPEPSRTLALLGRAVPDSQPSVLGAVLISSARAVCEAGQ